MITQARNAVWNSPNLDKRYSVFIEQAAKTDGSLSQAADTVLLTLAASPIGMPKAHPAAVAALDDGWKNPKRKVQIIAAAVTLRDTSRAAQIVEAMSDSSPEVAQAATAAVQTLGIDAEKLLAEAKLPRLATMQVTEVLDSVVNTKGDIARGTQLFSQLGCVACHTVSASEPPKGPFLAKISTMYKRRELAETILLPSKTIAQGFNAVSFRLKDGDVQEGFITREAADVITIRNANGVETKIPAAQIDRRVERTASMMPEALLGNSTINDFASLLDYLESLGK